MTSLPTLFEERLHRLQRQRDHALRGYERNRMSPELAEALRTEIRNALNADGQPFDVTVARRVYDLAIAARDMCVAATSGVKEAIATIKDVNGTLESLDSPNTPESQLQASETFGARLIREILATLPKLNQRSGDDPKALVHALAEARKRDMHDVAEALEVKLFGRVLSGPRPIGVVDGIEVAVGGYEHGFADGKIGAPVTHLSDDYREGYKDGTTTRLLDTDNASANVVAVNIEPVPPFDHSTRSTKHFDTLLGFCVCAQCAHLPEHEPAPTLQALANNIERAHASNCLARSYGEARECSCHRSKRLADDDAVPRYDDTELHGRPSNHVPMDECQAQGQTGFDSARPGLSARRGKRRRPVAGWLLHHPMAPARAGN